MNITCQSDNKYHPKQSMIFSPIGEDLNEVFCRNCGHSLCYLIIDTSSNKLYELEYSDANRVISYKYERLSYERFKNTQPHSIEENFFLKMTSILIPEEDFDISDFISNLELKIKKLGKFK